MARSVLKKIAAVVVLMAGAGGVEANIYDPDNSYLNHKKLPPAADAAEAERAYFIKNVSEVYGVDDPMLADPAKPGLPGRGPHNLTFDQWKTFNGFNSHSFKPVFQYYYNRADLGLLRAMWCVDQSLIVSYGPVVTDPLVAKLKARGKSPIACYVSNSGFFGGTIHDAINNFKMGEEPFATVAMEMWPGESGSDNGKNKARFFVFGPESTGGKLITQNPQTPHIASTIKLDNGKGQTQPGICMECHGGTFDKNGSRYTGEVTGAHFLPFDTRAMEFPGDIISRFFIEDYSFSYYRLQANDNIDKMNLMVMKSDQNAYGDTSEVTRSISAQYGDDYTNYALPTHHIDNPEHLLQRDNVVPIEYADDTTAYDSLIKPYCQSCHIAHRNAVKISNFSLDTIAKYACDPNSLMPHAEVNRHNMLRHADFVRAVFTSRQVTSGCAMPSLIDFESGQPDTLSSSFANFPAGVSGVSKTVIDPVLTGSIRRTLQIPPYAPMAAIVFEEKNYPWYTETTRLRSLSFSYFLMNPSDGFSIEYFIQGKKNLKLFFKKGSIAGVDIINGQFNDIHFTADGKSPALSPLSIPVGTYKAVVTLIRGQPNSIVELDDALVYFTAAHRDTVSLNTYMTDFETDNENPLNAAGLISSPDLNAQAGSKVSDAVNKCRDSRKSFYFAGDFSKQWYRSDASKVARDAGTVSFSSNGQYMCPADVLTFSLKLNAGFPGDTAKVDFDFRVDLRGQLKVSWTRPGSKQVLGSSIIRGTRDQIPVGEKFVAINEIGRATINVPGDAEITFAYTSGYRFNDPKADRNGASVDNIRVIYQR